MSVNNSDTLLFCFQADEYFCTGYKVADDILGQPGNTEAEGYIGKSSVRREHEIYKKKRYNKALLYSMLGSLL